jgi:hypothetical protein
VDITKLMQPDFTFYGKVRMEINELVNSIKQNSRANIQSHLSNQSHFYHEGFSFLILHECKYEV